MRIIALGTLRTFWESHMDAQGWLEAWYDHVSHVNWATPADVQKDYGDDVILPNNRAVFNVKGNRYRLVVKFEYKFQMVYIRFIGTHAEYDRIDVLTI